MLATQAQPSSRHPLRHRHPCHRLRFAAHRPAAYTPTTHTPTGLKSARRPSVALKYNLAFIIMYPHPDLDQVGQKPWQLTGEVSSKQRPLNSLLEATLDFEQATKAAPAITEEVSHGLSAVPR